MTDREMLELAAKALGMPEAPKQYRIADGLPIVITYMGKPWNPLTDDGDALRLAVKLAIGLQSYAALGYSHAGSESVSQSTVIKEQHNGDPYAATRRAITRAAAEIGRQMEVQS